MKSIINIKINEQIYQKIYNSYFNIYNTKNSNFKNNYFYFDMSIKENYN